MQLDVVVSVEVLQVLSAHETLVPFRNLVQVQYHVHQVVRIAHHDNLALKL